MKLDDATADRLRELGASDDMLQWLREPGAVRELLKYAPLYADRTEQCSGCGAPAGEAHQNWNGNDGKGLRHCEVAAAWRALGDRRGALDVDNAWDEALEQERPRTWDLSPEAGFTYSSRWVPLAATPYGRMEQVAALVRDGHIAMADVLRRIDDKERK